MLLGEEHCAERRLAAKLPRCGKGEIMKRALQLLLTLPLVAVAFTAAPAAARTCAVTCLQYEQQCDQGCEESLCQARFICDSSDPCDSTCTCIKCRP
jgi:hypothetical protein